MRNISIRWQLVGAFTVLSALLVLSTVSFSAWMGGAMMEAEIEARLSTLRDDRQELLTSFLVSIERHLQTMAAHSDVSDALTEFAAAAAVLPSEMAPATAVAAPYGARPMAVTPDPFPEANAAVAAYYNGPFAETYRANNDADPPRSLQPTDPVQIWMQAQYISNNPNALGEKDNMTVAGTGTTYDAVHASYHDLFDQELEHYGYYDIFLVDAATHRVVYSVFKEIDFGTDLRNGPYADSGLAAVSDQAFRAAPGTVVFTDFASYTPSYEAAAAFMGIPVTSGNEVVGALVVQFPIGELNAVMGNLQGLGETGRTYIVGGDDLMVRSQIRGVETNTVLAISAETEATQRALAGETGLIETTSFDGRDVLAIAGPLTFLGVTWLTVAEVDASEAFAALHAMLQWQIGVSAVLIALGLFGGFMLSRSIANPIEVVSSRMTKLAAGKFAPSIVSSRGDEVGQLNDAYNKLSTKLQGVIQDMQAAAIGLSSSAEQLMGNVQAQQSGATQQAAAVEETKQSVHVLLQSANSIASLGEDVLQNAQQAQTNASVIGSRIHELSSNSANITEILGLIKDIANKSEMLALNAALEGTKAGDAGRGFSLVATQMQRLAEQVMGSAKRIEALTSDINTASAASVLASEEAAKLALETTRSAQEITSAVSAQQAGTTEVDAAMDEVNEVARRSVDVARQMVDSANSLLELSEGLHGHVAQFDFSEVANTNKETIASAA